MDYDHAKNAVRLGWALVLIALGLNFYLFDRGDAVAALGMALAVLSMAGAYFFEGGRSAPLQLVTIAACSLSHAVWFLLALN